MWIVLALACAGAPSSPEPPAPATAPPVATSTERDIPFVGSGAFRVGERSLELTGATLAAPGGEGPVAVDLLGPPVAVGGAVCVVEDAGGDGRLVCLHEQEGALVAKELARGGRPDRLAASPDGVTLAWVASLDGLPAVFVGPADASAPPRPLTNVGLARPTGGPPPGFVPPPLGDSLRFDGDTLRWASPDGPQAVAWR